MRRPEVCKHQVCDHCGGRFGMVTHRWWGNKFCKRACKNAHRRENHHTQSGWVIPRFFTFAGGACLAAAVAVAMLTLLLASANAAPGEERPVAGSSLEFNKEDGTLYIDWSGPIVAGMADDLRAAHPRQARVGRLKLSRLCADHGAHDAKLYQPAEWLILSELSRSISLTATCCGSSHLMESVMPGYRFGRCDGHHEMVDFGYEMERV